MKRRQRNYDSLAHPSAIRSILQRLKSEEPAQFPALETDQIALLNALRYAQNKAPKRTDKGRPSPWSPTTLAAVNDKLQRALDDLTAGRVAAQTFICQYLPILNYPAEIIEALGQGQINRQEALCLARLSAKKLRITEEQAANIRQQLIRSHLLTHGSQNQLRQRVQEMLGESALLSRETLALSVMKADALLEVDADAVKHIFFETIKDLFFAIRGLEPEDLEEEDIAEFMQAADALSNVIRAIHHRKLKKDEKPSLQAQFAEETTASEGVQVSADPATGFLVYQFREPR